MSVSRPLEDPNRREQSLAFWRQRDLVERFAARDPDHRLLRLADRYASPPHVRVLDLGCAAGRNTVFLLERGFDVVARDFSLPMVEATRSRVAEVRGRVEAEARVRVGDMDRLDDLEDGSIDLIVALGIYHAASSQEEWDRTLGESRRVLARGGRLLVANHGLGYDPEGTGLTPVPGHPHLFDGLPSGRSYLVDAPTLDRELARFGLDPLAPTETVRRETEPGGIRVTVNGLYVRR
jgi:SAM-dependent methyltransferase